MLRNGRTILGMPEDRHLLEQGRVAGFGGVADFHAVVEERHAIEREHEGRGGQGAVEAEAGDGAGLVVVVGEAQVQGAAGELLAALFPGAFELGGGRAAEQDVVQRGVQGPGVIHVEGIDQQFGLAGLGEQDDVRLDLGQFGAGLLPEAGGDFVGDIAAEAVQVEGGGVNPMLEHGDHVFAQLAGSRSSSRRRPSTP